MTKFKSIDKAGFHQFTSNRFHKFSQLEIAVGFGPGKQFLTKIVKKVLYCLLQSHYLPNICSASTWNETIFSSSISYDNLVTPSGRHERTSLGNVSATRYECILFTTNFGIS